MFGGALTTLLSITPTIFKLADFNTSSTSFLTSTAFSTNSLFGDSPFGIYSCSSFNFFIFFIYALVSFASFWLSSCFNEPVDSAQLLKLLFQSKIRTCCLSLNINRWNYQVPPCPDFLKPSKKNCYFFSLKASHFCIN